jgi:hypothetical protein
MGLRIRCRNQRKLPYASLSSRTSTTQLLHALRAKNRFSHYLDSHERVTYKNCHSKHAYSHTVFLFPHGIPGVARMLVPKMVKNGFNLILHVSAEFEGDEYPRKSRIDMKTKAGPTLKQLF